MSVSDFLPSGVAGAWGRTALSWDSWEMGSAPCIQILGALGHVTYSLCAAVLYLSMRVIVLPSLSAVLSDTLLAGVVFAAVRMGAIGVSGV